MLRVEINEDEYRAFRELFYRRTGIWFEDSKRYFVDRRLADRIEATGSESFRQYYLRLRFSEDGPEWQALINAMTVNETYFFREAHQFDCLVNSMLSEIAVSKPEGGRIRIWSVPSSSGEEPYSIAIYLLERWRHLERYEVEILASDIDTGILEQARRGVYSQRSVQHLPNDYLRKYFHPLSNGDYQICEDLRQSVQFSQVNLMDSGATRRFRNVDVIFCRNLLIYFDDASRRRAAEVFYDALNHGGFICLGHSESMSRISSLFTVRRFPDAIVYQKPVRG
jgi:chemotaxis protein methyltransferase CheR